MCAIISTIHVMETLKMQLKQDRFKRSSQAGFALYVA